MKNSTSINLVTNPELEKLFQKYTDLKKGDQLEGKIREVRPDGKAVVDFGKFQAAVELKLPVKEGDVIRLVVVEKGKQLKLKVEHFESKSGAARQQEAQPQIKQADFQQERAIEELRSRIDQLVREESGASGRSQAGTGTQNQLKEINTQLGKLKEDLQASESKAPLPKELKQDIGKLLENTESTLRKLDRLDSTEASRRLEELSKAIKDLRSALDSHKEFREVRDRITKQVSQLKSLLKDSQLPAAQKEKLETVMSKISDAGDRVAQLKSADQAQELRRIVSEEIKPNLTEARQILERQPAEPSAGARQAAVELKHQLEVTGKAIDMSVQKLPPPAKDIDLLVKTLRQALNEIEKAPETVKPPDRAQVARDLEVFQKDISRELIKLKEQFQSPETRESLPKEIKNESEVLLKNAANALRQMPKAESGDIKTNLESLEKIEAVAKAVKNIRTSLDNNRDVQEARDRIVKQIHEIKSALEKSDIPVNKEVKAAIDKLSEAADKIARLKTSEQLPELRRIVSEEIKPNLTELRENLAKEAVVPGSEKAVHVAEQLNRVEALQKEIEIVLPKLSAPEAPAKDIEIQLKDFGEALRRLSDSPPPRAETVRNDIGKELLKVEEQLQARTAEGKEAIPKETRIEVEYVMKNAADMLRRLPQSQIQTADTDTAEKLEVLSKAVRSVRTSLEANRDFSEVRDRIAKELTELKASMEKSDVPLKKEVQAALSKLSEAAGKISNLKSPDQMAELRRIVSEEVKPNLTELRENLAKEAVVPGSEKAVQLAEQLTRVETVQKEIDISLARLPSPPVQSMEVQLDNVGLALGKLAEAPPQAPPSPEVTDNVGQALPQHEVLSQNIGKELQNLLEYVQTSSYRGEEVLPESQKPETAQLLKDIEIALQRLPEADRAEMTEHLKTLSRAVKSYRTSLDIRRDFQEVRDDMTKDIQRLKALVENAKADLPEAARKDVEAQIAKLSEAADKMARLKGPEQITELRRIIAQEIKPALDSIGQTLDPKAEAAAQQSDRAQQQMQAAETIKNETQQLSQNADKALQKLYPAPPRELDALVKNIESALYKIQPPPPSVEAAENVQFSENIQNLYDNIKSALRLLQSNIQVSGNKLELPEEIRQIFQDLQSSLKTADISDAILKQVSQLKTLVEEAGLPFDKMVEKIVGTLEEMLSRLSELKATNQHQEIRNFIQTQIKPFLGTLSEVFSDPKLAAESANPQKMAAIRHMLQSLSSAVDQTAAGAETKQPFDLSKLSQLTELTEQLAGLPKGSQQAAGTSTANLKASENISNLSQNIEELLSRLPENTQSTGNGAVTDKIRSLLSTLRSHFEPLDISDSAMKLVPKLKSLVENSGVFFEKKLNDILSKLSDASTRMRGIQSLEQLPEFREIIDNDIKPNLLQLKEFLNSERLTAQLGKGQTLDSIRNAVEEILSNIGAQQEKAVDSQAQQNPVQVFSFHLPIKDEEPAELKIFYNRGREKDSPDEYKLSLLLDMSNLGEIRSDFFNLKDDLNITFYVRDHAVKEFFDQNLIEIEDVLEPVFQNLSLNVIVSTEKISDFESEAQETQPTQILSDKAVDVKI